MATFSEFYLGGYDTVVWISILEICCVLMLLPVFLYNSEGWTYLFYVAVLNVD